MLRFLKLPEFATRALLVSQVLLTSCGEDPAFVQSAKPEEMVLPESVAAAPGAESENSTRARQTVTVLNDGSLISESGTSDVPTNDVAKPEESGSVAGFEAVLRSGSVPSAEDAGSPSSQTGVEEKTSASLSGMVITTFTKKGEPERIKLETEQSAGKADILWVIDDSASMRWAQLKLGTQFASFAQSLQSAGVDFQVGVTSTDMCKIADSGPYNDPDTYRIADEICPLKEHIRYADVTTYSDGTQTASGALRGQLKKGAGGASILKDALDFVQSFAALAQLGVNGSRYEHGLKAARESVRLGKESGFIRDQAFLSVIVLSDEEDDSVQFWCEDAWGKTTLDAAGNKDIGRCTSQYRYSPLFPWLSSPFKDQFELSSYALFGPTPGGAPYTQWKYTADQFVQELAAPGVKGAGKFRVNAITGVADSSGNISCNLSAADQELAALALQGQYQSTTPAPEKPYEVGTNYMKAAALTGGQVENICSSDWSALLANIGKNVTEQASQIALPSGKIPISGSLAVSVDRNNDGVFEPLTTAEFSHMPEGNFVALKSLLPKKTKIHIEFRVQGVSL